MCIRDSDTCGKCGGSTFDINKCIVPCENGTKLTDVCGVCEGDSTSCQDCWGTPNGFATIGICGCQHYHPQRDYRHGVCGCLNYADGQSYFCMGCTLPHACNWKRYSDYYGPTHLFPTATVEVAMTEYWEGGKEGISLTAPCDFNSCYAEEPDYTDCASLVEFEGVVTPYASIEGKRQLCPALTAYGLCLV